ncbi:hypothetical protein SKAU_G00246640 [Synaphobranchus kaupii]|uniref:H15 domain-containing protein n=1 Tax=Synaphobranchus kaupii TaxID=118154 RepID=A0A9Q1IPE4_SYNKA|nr:hypothetical protein SKAU_G00246640 [Synaphobranchus kaupii]
MAEVAPPTAATVAPAKAPKNKTASKPRKKALAANGYDVEKNNSRVNLAVRTLVTKGALVQTKGIGASGSFKVNRNQLDAKTKSVKKAVPKAKKAIAVKNAASKKPAIKKSQKKVSKPKAKKSPKKRTKGPKKAAKAMATPKKAKSKSARKTTTKVVKAKVAKPKPTKARKAVSKK